MPQMFQVLKCYKCAVFQVQQTKKSNKWECKLCGEKQSIKRHYGLGTGKECRLHVQKLNSIRGEVDNLNESIELSKNSDEELELELKNDTCDVDINMQDKAYTKNESKWSNFIDKTELVLDPEVNESMFLGNAEVVLEITAKKRRKFNTPKVLNTLTACSPYQEKELSEAKGSFVPNSNNICKPNLSHKNITTFSKLDVTRKENYYSTPNIEIDKLDNVNKQQNIETKIQNETVIDTYGPPKVNKNSKWAQFTDESDENEKPNTIHSTRSRENSELPNNIFSLCDEKELDKVLDL